MGNVVIGTDELAPKQALQCYPNPVSDELAIDAGNMTVSRVVVADLNGTPVGTYAPQNRINVSGLAPGMYLLQVVTDQGIAVQKFVKL